MQRAHAVRIGLRQAFNRECVTQGAFLPPRLWKGWDAPEPGWFQVVPRHYEPDWNTTASAAPDAAATTRPINAIRMPCRRSNPSANGHKVQRTARVQRGERQPEHQPPRPGDQGGQDRRGEPERIREPRLEKLARGRPGIRIEGERRDDHGRQEERDNRQVHVEEHERRIEKPRTGADRLAPFVEQRQSGAREEEAREQQWGCDRKQQEAPQGQIRQPKVLRSRADPHQQPAPGREVVGRHPGARAAQPLEHAAQLVSGDGCGCPCQLRLDVPTNVALDLVGVNRRMRPQRALDPTEVAIENALRFLGEHRNSGRHRTSPVLRASMPCFRTSQ